ncbi:hypothetical protein PG984_001403 [Apiospora sp. TS-2023a]
MANSSDPTFGSSVLPNQVSRGLSQRFFLAWNDGLQAYLHNGEDNNNYNNNRQVALHPTSRCISSHSGVASLGNVAYLPYQLGYQAVSAFAVGTTFLPILWAFLALPIHVVGASALHLRCGIRPATDSAAGFNFQRRCTTTFGIASRLIADLLTGTTAYGEALQDMVRWEGF